jgi:hypothetical protein
MQSAAGFVFSLTRFVVLASFVFVLLQRRTTGIPAPTGSQSETRARRSGRFWIASAIFIVIAIAYDILLWRLGRLHPALHMVAGMMILVFVRPFSSRLADGASSHRTRLTEP